MVDTLVLGTSANGLGVQVPSCPPKMSNACGSSSVVERYLAKVDVASSSLVSRSILLNPQFSAILGWGFCVPYLEKEK